MTLRTIRLLRRRRRNRINGLHYVKHLRLKALRSLRDGQSSVGGGCTYREDSAARTACAFTTICDYSSRGNTPGCELLESGSLYNKIIHPSLGSKSESICPLFSENTSQVMRSMRLQVNLHPRVARLSYSSMSLWHSATICHGCGD